MVGRLRVSLSHGESQHHACTLHDAFGDGTPHPRYHLAPPGTSLGRIIEELYLIWEASTAEEYQDALLFIPL
jgi:hypothetical protein